ncbi:MAG: hypothetical protein AAF560_23150 [Acidobacteriota bacterium]
MWIRLRKEMRALAVPWAQSVTVLLFVFYLLAGVPASSYVSAGVFWGLCCFLASRVIGVELDNRTLQALLSQPVPRSLLWREKMLAGAVALGAILLVLRTALRFVEVKMLLPDPLGDFSWPWLLAPLAALATGPTLSLVLRDSVRTLWASFVLPIGVSVVVTTVWTLGRNLVGAEGRGVLSLADVLLPYSVLMLGLGYWRFSSLELVAGEPVGKPASVAAAPSSQRGSSEGLLWRKEFHLHRSSLMLIPLMVLVGLTFWLLSFRPNMRLASGHLVADWLEVLGHLPIWGLLVVVPLLLGCSAVAGERQLSVLGWQLALPFPRRKQWRFKVFAGLGLAVSSAIIGFLLAQLLSQRIDLGELEPQLIGLTVLAFMAGLYASRLATTPFRALGLSLMLVLAGGYVLGLAKNSSRMVSLVGPEGLVEVLDLGGKRPGGLVELVVLGLAILLVARVPQQQDWLSGRRLMRSRGLWWSVVFVVVASTAQALVLAKITHRLGQEIVAKDAEIVREQSSSGLDWLADSIGLSAEQLDVDHLITFIRLSSHLTSLYSQDHYGQDMDSSDSPASDAFYLTTRVHRDSFEPLTRAMRSTLLIDGTGHLPQYVGDLYFIGSRQVLRRPFFAPMTFRSTTVQVRRAFTDRLAAYSLVSGWWRDERLRRFDRRMQQNVRLEAMRLSQALKQIHEADPERGRHLEQLLGTILEKMVTSSSVEELRPSF